jgi:hypothetical protein
MKKLTKKKRILLILCAALLLASAVCFLVEGKLTRLLPSQYAAERWKGEGEEDFAQVTCFLTVDEPIDLNEIYRFRYAILDQLHGAGYEADTDTLLFRDAWSLTGRAKVSSELGHGEASVTAVGGNYFDFHPIRLLSGCYLAENDVTEDRVLLDEDLAWLLFGGVDLQGMQMEIDGVPFVVGGVIEREQDFASKRAYTSGMGLYMSYDAYVLLHEDAGATCYELVLTEPVDGFTLSFVQEKFPIGQGEILENSGRFSFGKILGLIGQFGTRSMQTHGVLYPYWENAARSVEDWSALLLLLGLLFLAFPAVLAATLLIRLLLRAKRKLSEDILPGVKEKTGEAIRKQQRRHWEKTHKDMK